MIANIGLAKKSRQPRRVVSNGTAQPEIPIRHPLRQGLEQWDIKPLVDAALIESNGSPARGRRISACLRSLPEGKVTTIWENDHLTVVSPVLSITFRNAI